MTAYLNYCLKKKKCEAANIGFFYRISDSEKSGALENC